MELITNVFVFIVLISLMVYVTRTMLIKSIRTIAVYLKWDNKLVGQILGYATSMPELLSSLIAASIGMIATSIYNILSSNIINLILVIIITVYLKRFKGLLNKKLIFSYILVAISIIVPMLLIYFDIAINIEAVPILTNIYLLFIISSQRTYYFEDDLEIIEEQKKRIQKDEKNLKTRKLSSARKRNVRVNVLILIISIILLYTCSNIFGIILNNLGEEFNVPEIVLGIILGMVTATPELMTFLHSYKKHKKTINPINDKGSYEVVTNLVTSNVSNIAIIHSLAILVYYFIHIK